jgi:hypothetical protein
MLRPATLRAYRDRARSHLMKIMSWPCMHGARLPDMVPVFEENPA